MSTWSVTTDGTHPVIVRSADHEDLNAAKGILAGLALGAILFGVMGSVVFLVWR